MRPQLIVLDVDGTLLTSQGRVSESTRAMLGRARELGIGVMISSGRPVAGLPQYVEALGLAPEGVLLSGFNGAQVCDAATGAVISQRTLAPDLTRRLHEGMSALPVSRIVPIEDKVYVLDDEAFMAMYEAEENDTRLIVVADLFAAAPSPPKILVSAAPEVLQ